MNLTKNRRSAIPTVILPSIVSVLCRNTKLVSFCFAKFDPPFQAAVEVKLHIGAWKEPKNSTSTKYEVFMRKTIARGLRTFE